MNTYNDLFNKILNEYQINQTPVQNKNPIVDNLINYLKNSGIDTSNIKPEDMETILNNKEINEVENDKNDNTETLDKTKLNTQVKSNVVSNIPVNNLTNQNKNLQKNI
jgi:hypothetical protein